MMLPRRSGSESRFLSRQDRPADYFFTSMTGGDDDTDTVKSAFTTIYMFCPASTPLFTLTGRFLPSARVNVMSVNEKASTRLHCIQKCSVSPTFPKRRVM